ncbi:MAG: hypothetical protein ABSC48_19740 [Terracidiphilus sp.]|jgi:hypothetical protein
MPQEFFTFYFWAHVFYAFLGAGLLYARWGRSKLKTIGLSNFLDIFDLSEKVRVRLEMLLFLTIGTLVAMGIAQPTNAVQALTAGLGWTGLVARPRS